MLNLLHKTALQTTLLRSCDKDTRQTVRIYCRIYKANKGLDTDIGIKSVVSIVDNCCFIGATMWKIN